MTPAPTTVPSGTSIAETARVMRDQDLGALLVQTGSGTAIVTDRDLVIRGVADVGDPRHPVGVVASRDVVTVNPERTVDEAIDLMRERALRRLVVTEGNRPIGILSLSDVEVEQAPHSTLGQISKAVPNR
jgi:CBS domain-containing protein